MNYVDSFYGQNDPLYPMMSKETKQPLTKFDILRATENYLSMCSDEDQQIYALGGMAILLTERESETFYFMITTTNLWGSNELHTQRSCT